MVLCALYGCNEEKTKQSKLKFYSFPKNDNLYKVWENSCKRDDKLPKDPRICEKHFSEEQKYLPYKYKLTEIAPPRSFRDLKSDAIPDLNLPNRVSVSTYTEQNDQNPRLCRIRKREYTQVVQEIMGDENNNKKMKLDSFSRERPKSDLNNYDISRLSETENMQSNSNLESSLEETEFVAAEQVTNYSMESTENEPISQSFPDKYRSPLKQCAMITSTPLAKNRTKMISPDLSSIQNNSFGTYENFSETERNKLLLKIKEYEKEIDRQIEINKCKDIIIDNQRKIIVAKELAEIEHKREKTEFYNERRRFRETVTAYKKQVENNKIETAEFLKGIFTETQLKVLRTGKRPKEWSPEDISAGITLHSMSAKTYRYLRNKKGYPFPCVSSLKVRAAKISCEPGNLEHVLKIMKARGANMKETEKLCCLSADEMKISEKVEYNPKLDQCVGPYKNVQVIMARGLFAPWKQPIYYNFDTPLKKELLDDIIIKLHESGFTAVSFTTDCGGGNQTILNDYELSTTKTYFNHPVTGGKIFYFADAPHLLKLIRNHLLDHDYHYKDKIINKDAILDLVKVNSSGNFGDRRDVTISHEINEKHTNCIKNERQNVKLAAQLMSNSTSAGVTWCGQRGLTKANNWREVSQYIKEVNDWFDVLNCNRIFYDSRPTKQAYGRRLEEQKKILETMIKRMENMRKEGSRSLMPFQKGVIITSKSLMGLYDYLKELYGIQYIMTYRLNQDCLENFFSVMRSMGAMYTNPSSLQFSYRIRKHCLQKNPEIIVSANSNVQATNDEQCLDFVIEESKMEPNVAYDEEEYKNDDEEEPENDSDDEDEPESDSDDEEDSVNFHDEQEAKTNEEKKSEKETKKDEEKISTESKKDSNLTSIEILSEPYDTVSLLNWQKEKNQKNCYLNAEDLECIQTDEVYNSGLLGIAGYIAYRLKNTLPDIDLANTGEKVRFGSLPNWVETLSDGGLTYPSEWLFNAVKAMDKVFLEFHGKSINYAPKIVETMCKDMVEKQLSIHEKIMYLFARTRMFIRIKQLNLSIRKGKFDSAKWNRKKKILQTQ